MSPKKNILAQNVERVLKGQGIYKNISQGFMKGLNLPKISNAPFVIILVHFNSE